MKKNKILVTGGAGFIGSNIVDAYINAGHSVAVMDNLSSGKKANVNSRARFYRVDITNAPGVRKVFAKERFDIVSHHAAQIDVRKSVADPGFDAKINILGALNVLEAARSAGVKKVIFSSSGGTIYGECGRKAPDEKFPGRPISPYGITKFALEFYLKYYAAIYGMKYTCLRYANVYGPRQDPHGEAGVVAIFSERMLKNDDLFIFGDGKQERDYVFVGDVVRANVLALDKGDNEIINVGTKVLTSVNGLFREMAKASGYSRKPVYKPARPGELMKSYLGVSKARTVLGWKPVVPLSEGLKRTIDYFRDKRENKK